VELKKLFVLLYLYTCIPSHFLISSYFELFIQIVPAVLRIGEDEPHVLYKEGSHTPALLLCYKLD